MANQTMNFPLVQHYSEGLGKTKLPMNQVGRCNNNMFRWGLITSLRP